MTRLSLFVAIGVILLGGVLALRATQSRSVIDDSISRLQDSGRFATSTRAGNTIAEISVRLRQQGNACRDSDRESARCASLLSAAAYAAVTAYTLLDCTAPGVHDGRVAMLRYLRAVRTFVDGDADGIAPTVPKVVTC